MLFICLSNLQSVIKPSKSNLQSRDNSRNLFVFFSIKLDSKLLKIIIFFNSLIRLSNDNVNIFFLNFSQILKSLI